MAAHVHGLLAQTAKSNAQKSLNVTGVLLADHASDYATSSKHSTASRGINGLTPNCKPACVTVN
ncbi:hypothetical protein H8K35_03930 [Undibacterium sp. LX40W]|uniref:Uncharacterized protein n=1 Tax=Undibacterium nitidum TaxID=2762298 RepID=A0A923HQ76_9BURK|nr:MULTISPECIES: hypothetical protein [Undibacterium]MBC3880462.1 hypothetical protein [Undibacterium nitidum]MBC3890802.1 hypothetical protein [Undibacterium sp. LX40W]